MVGKVWRSVLRRQAKPKLCINSDSARFHITDKRGVREPLRSACHSSQIRPGTNNSLSKIFNAYYGHGIGAGDEANDVTHNKVLVHEI